MGDRPLCSWGSRLLHLSFKNHLVGDLLVSSSVSFSLGFRQSLFDKRSDLLSVFDWGVRL